MAWSLRGKVITVAAAGTPVIGNATTQLVKGLTITADANNTAANYVFVQDSATATAVHARLSPGQQLRVGDDNEVDLSKIYFDKVGATGLVQLAWLQPV